jgi:hypothetical protein
MPRAQAGSKILAILLNRLATNSLQHEWRPDGRDTVTRVRITLGGAELSCPEELLAALVEELGADVEMQIVSRVTGFGYGAPKLQKDEAMRVHAQRSSPCQRACRPVDRCLLQLMHCLA